MKHQAWPLLCLIVACSGTGDPDRTTTPAGTPVGSTAPVCAAPMGTCDAGPCATDHANDPNNCGSCGNVCSGSCELGECSESRARRHKISMTSGEACVVREGQVWCWQQTPTFVGDSPELIYGDDAEQVVLHGNDYAILRQDGSVHFELRTEPVVPWTVPVWDSGVLDLGSNTTSFLVGQRDDGLLLWHDSTVFAAVIDNPPQHVARVGGGYPDNACWQIQGGRVWCLFGRSAAAISDTRFVDWSVGSKGKAGLATDGELVGVAGASPISTGITGAVQVASGLDMHCGLLATGQVQCLEASIWADTTDLGTVAGLDDAVAIAAGGYIGCAVRADDSVACWLQQELPLTAVDIPFP